jgi:glycosyltransferase involved in cell wall biosynthesis
MRSASLLVFPSRYEGFGLPALEAMASGIPTVLAEAGSLPEVGGSAALYFSPGNASELGERLERLITDSGLRAELVARGLERARERTWHRTAEATAGVYRLARDGRDSSTIAQPIGADG